MNQRSLQPSSSITARVGLGLDGQAFGLAVTLVGALPTLDEEAARQLMADAHQVCPYSRATRGNVDVTLELA
ncbi:MAG: OsmC family protein [Proteobacteria bacterium]|nr:OsmC family protein [Pseudomonadota bacterium]